MRASWVCRAAVAVCRPIFSRPKARLACATAQRGRPPLYTMWGGWPCGRHTTKLARRRAPGTRVRTNSATFCPEAPKFDPASARLRPKLVPGSSKTDRSAAKVWPRISPRVGQSMARNRPKFLRPNLARFRPKLARNRPTLACIRPILDRNLPMIRPNDSTGVEQI